MFSSWLFGSYVQYSCVSVRVILTPLCQTQRRANMLWNLTFLGGEVQVNIIKWWIRPRCWFVVLISRTVSDFVVLPVNCKYFDVANISVLNTGSIHIVLHENSTAEDHLQSCFQACTLDYVIRSRPNLTKVIIGCCLILTCNLLKRHKTSIYFTFLKSRCWISVNLT